ncbi:hypothetical protein [Butyrivibrio sp. INlla14]|uniref:hypothetical protein n=1 Tax=Butyrivibrio sp. INlla14 TaxID=1520808 RepID=UPI000876932B|nr:hypothetical protein [Butyrivibrio sp. INlla14]SCY73364.1 hypothetical protein SAMN02910371_03639 [Butyrivibrio sp. INlla14]
MPGPIVHFLESYYRNGYEGELLLSLKRKPTEHTAWMANRILNDQNFSNREEMLRILRESIERDDIDESTKNSIKEFLDYQEQIK